MSLLDGICIGYTSESYTFISQRHCQQIHQCRKYSPATIKISSQLRKTPYSKMQRLNLNLVIHSLQLVGGAKT